MRQATSSSTGKPYGLARVCRVWQLARSTVYWHRHTPAEPGTRRGAVGPGTDDELVDHIRRILEASSFPGEGYRKVWARLRYQGIRTSPRRVLRLMRAHGLFDHIVRILEASSFPGEGYRKVWARLRYQGIRTSPRRVLRLMRAHGLLAPTRHGHPHGPKAHDGTIIPTQVDTMWGTDMTATYTRQDGQVAIFIAVDH